jgi:predicted secreted protein
MVNPNMPILGNNLMIFLNPTGGSTNLKPCAFSTNATLTTSVNEIDLSNKDSARWKEAMTGDFQWSLACDTLMNLTGVTGNTLSTKELFVAYTAGLPVYVAFAIVAGSTPSWTIKTASAGALKFTGEANIVGMDFASPLKEKATANIKLNGTGILNCV